HQHHHRDRDQQRHLHFVQRRLGVRGQVEHRREGGVGGQRRAQLRQAGTERLHRRHRIGFPPLGELQAPPLLVVPPCPLVFVPLAAVDPPHIGQAYRDAV